MTTLLLLAAFLQTDPGDGIALVLSGGGARGLAHIGALLALEEEGVPVRAVSGTSMGALVGGLYACGWSAIQIDSIARSIDWDDLFSGSPRREMTLLPQRLSGTEDLVTLGLRGMTPVLPPSAISTQRLATMFVSLTGLRQLETGPGFDSLPIPLRIVAFDLEGGRRVVHSSGDLATAMLSSMAIPSVFPAVRMGGSLLVDGGVADNMPVDVAVATWDLPVLAIDISSPPGRVPLEPSLVETGTLTLDALISRVNALYEEQADWTIEPDLGGARAWSFGMVDSLIDDGYEATKAFLDAHPAIPRTGAAHHSWHPGELRVRNILLGGLDRIDHSAVFAWMDIERGDILGPEEIRQSTEMLYASGLFSSVIPELEETGSPGEADLVFRLRERDPAEVGLGLTYHSGFGLDGRLTYRTSNFLGIGRRLVLSAGGGDNYVFSEFTVQDQSARSRFFQQLTISAWQVGQYTYDEDDRIGHQMESRLEAELAHGISLGWFGLSQIGIGWSARGEPDSAWCTFGRVFLRGLTETLDDPLNPSRGNRLRAELSVSPLRRCHQSFDAEYTQVVRAGRRTRVRFDGWTGLLAGDAAGWQYYRTTASRSIPGQPWNSLPARERLAGSLTVSRDLKGPFLVYLRGACAWDWDTPMRPSDGRSVYGVEVGAGARTPAGPARISWGINSEDRTEWVISVGSPATFGPGR
jgi:NTE family protein